MKIGSFALLLVAAVSLLPAVAVAGDAPYAPEQQSPGDLLITERFDESPLAFPWQRVSSSRITQNSRLDFELVYDADFQTVYDRFMEAHSGGEDFIGLNEDALRYIDVSELRIMGHQLGDDGGRITIGHPDLEALFSADLRADGTQTRITVHNRLRSRQFSGFVPARVGFQPIDAQKIPLRWD